MDPILLFAVFGLVGCSMATLSAASIDSADANFATRQLIYAGVGTVLMLLVTRMNYMTLRKIKYPLYGSMIGITLLVLTVGGVTRGTRRWVELPFFRFQPSELGKIILVVVLAAFVVDRTRSTSDRTLTLRVLGLAFLPAVLVVLQPDLGTGIVYGVIAVAVLFLAGAPWQHFAIFGGLATVLITFVLGVAPAVGLNLLKPYQVDRLTAFINPSKNPGDESYQQVQSQIAIGSGQKVGRGAERATQTRLSFLPERQNDFIFAVVGETYGFGGAGLILTLYALIIWRGLRVVTTSKTLYGSLLAGGVVGMLLFQIFINVGMTLGIMPITGIPLPLMSAGGSSMLVTMMAIGLIQSVYVHSRYSTNATVQVAKP